MKEYRTNIAVVGGGAAGMSAAAAAAEAGATVTVLESNAAVGGNGLFPRGIFAVDSPIQRRKLIFADRDETFKDCMAYSHWKIDARLVRALIDKSGDTISWLEGMGVKFADVVHHIPNQTPEVFHISDASENVGKATIRALSDFCRARGVTILTNTRGKRLLQDSAGAVIGVAAQTKDGEELVIHADKVIVSTGGFSGNDEMINKYYPNFNRGAFHTGSLAGMRHPGDGVQMATAAGADIEGNFAMEISAPRIKKGYDALQILLGKPHNVWLNMFGARFADEGIVYNFAQAANAFLRQPGGVMWVVFDSALLNRTLSDGRDIIEFIHNPPDVADRLPEAMKKAQADGILAVSDSVAGLSAQIGCPEDALVRSIEEYNTFCDAGHDALFAKMPCYLSKLSNPPYYAVKAAADMLITHGGIRINERFEALRADFAPVPNLYVAGVDFGGADADVYNVVMSGHGFGFAVNSGRMAGENALKALNN